MYESSFSVDWPLIGRHRLQAGQIELYYAPYMDNTTCFPGTNRYTTVDFHLHPSLLASYREQFPLLDNFMKKADRKEPARLFDGKQYSCASIDHLVREMINYQFIDELVPRYYESYVHLLMIRLLERISVFNPRQCSLSLRDQEKARLAREMLTTDTSGIYTIKALCKELETNAYSLKAAFRFLFNTSIGRYKRSVMMGHAKILLETTDLTIDDISVRLGYSSSQSFSTAFRNYYKKVPGSFRRQR